MKVINLVLAVVLIGGSLMAQAQSENRNVIVITLDGFRWQELFKGVDSGILDNHKFVSDRSKVEKFVTRESLLPFFWNVMAVRGQLYGNREFKSYVNCANPYWFSYPGYHELLVGAVDRKIRSNAKNVNPNSTVLEYINQLPAFHNKVAAFSTWDVFPYILRESISGIPVNSGLELVTDEFTTPTEDSLNQTQRKAGKRRDSVTFHLAFEHLKKNRSKLLYVALDETDEHSHAGRYDEYLLAAHAADQWIANLWEWIQSQPDYQDQTTLLITADHGRGRNASKNWRNHGRLTFGSDEIWMAVMGPDTPGDGEMHNNRIYQKQMAKTIATFLGERYENKFEVGEVIHSMIAPVALIANVNKQVEAVSTARDK